MATSAPLATVEVRLGLGLEDPRQGRVVLDEVVATIRVLGDRRHDLLVVVDVDADGGDAHPAARGALGHAPEAGDVAHAVVGVAVAEEDHLVDVARDLLEQRHPCSMPQEMQVSPPRLMRRMSSRIRSRVPALTVVGGTTT